jgi:hypothetical protein
MTSREEREIVRKAKREEREECARMCESMAYGSWLQPGLESTLRDIAHRIRTRGDSY